MKLFATHTAKEDIKKSEFELLKEECKLLFSMSCLTSRGKYGSCGICCSHGWYEPLKKLCCKLEALNLTYYPKFRVRVEAQQIKEKYGTLRFYYQVKTDASFIRMFASKILDLIHGFMLDNIDYKYKDIIDAPAYVSHEVVELKKSQYLKEKLHYTNCSNVHCEERDGKYFKISDMEHYKKFHAEPSKHKIANKLMSLVWRASNALSSNSLGSKMTSKQHVIVEMLDSIAEQYVKEAENECFNRCEKCGSQIGTDWSPRCETLGWVRYLCDDCAEEEPGSQYMKNGELWNGKVRIQSAEEVKKHSDEIDNRIAQSTNALKVEEENLKKEIEKAEQEERKEKEENESQK